MSNGSPSESAYSKAEVDGTGYDESRLPLTAILACVILVTMPPIFVLVTWQQHFTYTAVRHYSIPVLVAEAAVVILAMAAGFSLRSALSGLDLMTKVAGAVWLSALLIATYFASSDPAAAKALLATDLIHVFFLLALWDRFGANWNAARRPVVICACVGLALFTISAVALAFSVKGDPAVDWLAFGAGVTNVRQLGLPGLALVGFAAGRLAAGPISPATRWLLPLLCIGFFLVDWSGGRACFLGSLAAISLVWFFAPKENGTPFLGFAIPALLLAIPLSIIASPDPLFGAERLFSRLIDVGSASDVNSYSSNRVDIWMGTMHAIIDQPFIGHGEGQFRHLVEEAMGAYNHPHNAILQFLFAWGVIGTLAFAVMLARPLMQIPGISHTRPAMGLPAIGVLTGLGVASLFEGGFYHALPVSMAMIALAILRPLPVTGFTKTSP